MELLTMRTLHDEPCRSVLTIMTGDNDNVSTPTTSTSNNNSTLEVPFASSDYPPPVLPTPASAAATTSRRRSTRQQSIGSVLCLLLLLLHLVAIVILPYFVVYADLAIFAAVVCLCCWAFQKDAESSSHARSELLQIESGRQELLEQDILVRKCLEVKIVLPQVSKAAVDLLTADWGPNVLDDQLADDYAYWLVKEEDDDEDEDDGNGVCYLFSKPLSTDDTKAAHQTNDATTPAAAMETESSGSNAIASNEIFRLESGQALRNMGRAARTGLPTDYQVANAADSINDDIFHTNVHGAVCDICMGCYAEGDLVAWSRNVGCRHAFHLQMHLELAPAATNMSVVSARIHSDHEDAHGGYSDSLNSTRRCDICIRLLQVRHTDYTSVYV